MVDLRDQCCEQSRFENIATRIWICVVYSGIKSIMQMYALVSHQQGNVQRRIIREKKEEITSYGNSSRNDIGSSLSDGLCQGKLHG